MAFDARAEAEREFRDPPVNEDSLTAALERAHAAGAAEATARAEGDITAAVFSRMWDVLTEKHGKCGHCGKRKCPLREEWDTIPDGARLPLADIEDAVRAARSALATERTGAAKETP